MSLVLKPPAGRGEAWSEDFAARVTSVPVHVWPDCGDPAAVEYLALWEIEPGFLARFPNLKLVFSLGAGVDQFDLSLLPTQVRLVRLIEPSLTAGMVEYVTAFVLAVHRDLPLYARQQAQGLWRPWPERQAVHTRVGIMGLGALGAPCAKAVARLGFVTSGWNRSPRTIEGVTVFAGAGSRDAFLEQTDILVCLLPLTDETRGLFNRDLFARLPKGASFINAGRGPQVVGADLLAALDSGHMRWAVLDVTDPEPLPVGDPLWSHPQVVVTPHIASTTQAGNAGASIDANIRCFQEGEPLVGLVDPVKRY